MGLFDLLDKAKKKLGLNTTEKEEPEDEGEVEAEITGLLDFPPYEWFFTEDGKKEFEEYTSPQAYAKQNKLEKEEDNLFSLYHTCIHSGALIGDGSEFKVQLERLPKIPLEFFDMLLNSIFYIGKEDEEDESLEFISFSQEKWYFDVITSNLVTLAKRFDIDENGEPIERKLPLEYFQLISVDENPILNFVKNFKGYDSSVDDPDNLLPLHFLEVITFISACVYKGYTNVLNTEPWLFDKSSYLTSMGTPKTKVGFLNNAIEKASTDEYKEYFKSSLEKVRNS